MSLSVRVRFEVFKRDRFTCAYCGKHPPDVLLEVDHVIPRAAGGTDDEDNLVTACWECNHGKSDRLLEEGARPVSPTLILDANERLDQARAYAESMLKLRAIQQQQEWVIVEAWATAYGAKLEERESGTSYILQWDDERFPNRASIMRLLRRMPADEMLDCVDITASRFPRATADAERYFFGCCWRRVREREG